MSVQTSSSSVKKLFCHIDNRSYTEVAWLVNKNPYLLRHLFVSARPLSIFRCAIYFYFTEPVFILIFFQTFSPFWSFFSLTLSLHWCFLTPSHYFDVYFFRPFIYIDVSLLRSAFCIDFYFSDPLSKWIFFSDHLTILMLFFSDTLSI